MFNKKYVIDTFKDEEVINRLKEREKEILEEMDFYDNFNARSALEEELYEILDTLKKLEVQIEQQG